MQKTLSSQLLFTLPLLFTFFSCTSYAEDQGNFANWKANFYAFARQNGISEQTLKAADQYIAFDPRVLTLDQKQPEKTQSFADYLANTVNADRIAEARQKYQTNKDLLDAIEEKYHVQSEVLVAIWALESNFGERQGNYATLTSLATLTYDGRRRELFETELLDALEAIQDEHINPAVMTGSWAGAMGECQFMPSSLLKYGTDWDGDGTIDIWHSDADALASIARYLSENNWDFSQGIGLQVRLPEDFNYAANKEKLAKPLTEWHALGVVRSTGAALYLSGAPATLVMPDGQSGQTFLAYDNFSVLMHWNRSTYFALAIADLAGRINPKLKNKTP